MTEPDPEAIVHELMAIGHIDETFPPWPEPASLLAGSTTMELPIAKVTTAPRYVYIAPQDVATPVPDSLELQHRRAASGALFLAVIGCVLGLLLGLCIGGTHTETRTVVKRVTVTITATPNDVPGPTQTILAVPESCQAAIQYEVELEPYVKQIIDVAGPASDDLQEAFVAVADKDVSAINAAIDKLNRLNASLTTPEQSYLQLLKDSRSSIADCLKQTNN